MNQYHIYAPIGRGKHSVVYKGRKKRSVEYVAIKSTDRSQKPRVLQEVKVMHTVKHPNILRFHAWYETTNHLWLILEYCVGGDLRALLRADKQLPEPTVLRFGRDLAAALQHLHSIGTLHCDLNPSNLLLDENGRVKLGGFSLSRRNGDAAAGAAGVPAGQTGGSTPFYTAPELLQGEGQPSAASDLWSLGCILYECVAGKPPFVSTSISSLAALMQSSEPAPLVGVSQELQDLVSRLLEKDPASRLTWAELCSHAFWGASPLTRLAIPEAIAAPRAVQGETVVDRSSMASSTASTAQPLQPFPLEHRGSAGLDETDVSPPRTNLRPPGLSEDEDSAAGLDLGATPLHPSSRQRAPEQPSGVEPWQAGVQQLQAQQAVQGQASEGGPTTTASPPPDSLEALIWHPADLAMKPIVGNRRIERPLEAAINPALLPFKPLAAQELLAAPVPARSSFLLTLQRVLGGSAHQHTKLAVLCYLETLAVDTLAAHELINSELCVFLVRLMHGTTNAVLRARLANVLGLLIRHTSVIQDSLANAGILEALAGGLADSDPDVQRRSTAALGELLFYIASQQRTSSGGGGGGGAAGEQLAPGLGLGANNSGGGGGGAWQVPGEVVELLLGTLGPGGEEVVQHYVVKTIENIAGQGGLWAHKFATPEVVESLSQVVASGGSDTLRGTAASALCRFLRVKPALLPAFLTGAGMGFISQGLSDSSPRVQQASITLLCLLCINPSASQRALQAAEAEQQALLPALCGILEHSAELLRAKGVVATAALCRGGPSLLCALCSHGVLQRAEKSGKEQGALLANALAALRAEVGKAVPGLLTQMASSLRSIQPGSAAASSSAPLPQMTTLLYLLGSPHFRDIAASGALVTSLADILTRAVSSAGAWAGHQEVKNQVLQAIDGVCSHPELLLQHHDPVFSQLLPALSAAVASSKESSDTRFVCLKLLCDIVLQAVTEPSLFYPEAGLAGGGGGANGGAGGSADSQGLGAANELINAAVSQYVLPLTPALLADEDPMPLYALKMLGVLLEVNPAWVMPLARLGVARRFFEWLSIDHPHNNVHNIRLCRLITQSGALSARELADLRVVDRVLAVLSYAHEMGVEPFLEPSLELCLALMEALSQQAAGSVETSKLLPAVPLLLELCLHPDGGVAAAAAACLAGVTQLHPEDAAAILAANNGFAVFASLLQPTEDNRQSVGSAAGSTGSGLPAARLNEEAAYHVVHAVALAVQQPALQRHRDAVEQLIAAVRGLVQGAASGGLRQAAAEALGLLSQAAGRPSYA